MISTACAGVSVHLVNSIVAWLDIILARRRSFSKRSQWLSIVLVLFYLHWILLCSHINGGFPYPFLNKLPQPQASFQSAQCEPPACDVSKTLALWATPALSCMGAFLSEG